APGTARRVLVVGGGAGGLETARSLAAAGHDVTIWEQAPRLGGVLIVGGQTDPLLDRYLGWLLHEIDRLGVKVELGRCADEAAVAAHGADEVVLAVGAAWDRPDLPGADRPIVHTIDAVGQWLENEDAVKIGPRVVLLGGSKVALSLASACLSRGRTVT